MMKRILLVVVGLGAGLSISFFALREEPSVPPAIHIDTMPIAAELDKMAEGQKDMLVGIAETNMGQAALAEKIDKLAESQAGKCECKDRDRCGRTCHK
jgi:hypothetical protein